MDYVHLAETTRGTNTNPYALHNICKDRGQSNEYGFAAHDGYCFKSHQEATERVKRWFKENLEDLTVGEALCRYNLGINTEGCDYHKTYLVVSGNVL